MGTLSKEDERYLEGKMPLGQYYRIVKDGRADPKKGPKSTSTGKAHKKR